MSFRAYLDWRERKWRAERNNVEFTKNNLSIDQIYSIIISSIPSDRHTFIFLSEKKKKTIKFHNPTVAQDRIHLCIHTLAYFLSQKKEKKEKKEKKKEGNTPRWTLCAQFSTTLSLSNSQNGSEPLSLSSTHSVAATTSSPLLREAHDRGFLRQTAIPKEHRE